MAPYNISTNATHGTSILVQWLPIPEEHHKGILLGYRIYYQEYDLSGPLWPMQVVNDTGLLHSWELVGLNLTSNYSIQVGGFTSIGMGNISDVVYGMSGMYGKLMTCDRAFVNQGTWPLLFSFMNIILSELWQGNC